MTLMHADANIREGAEQEGRADVEFSVKTEGGKSGEDSAQG